jgi:autotransporter translocation and assembly factor TamB
LEGNIFLPLSLSKLRATSNWLSALSDDPRFDVDLALDPIDLGELAAVVTTQPKMSGKAAGRIELSGAAAALEGKSDLHWRDFVFGDEARLSADLETRLASKVLSLKTNASASGSDPVKIEASIPWRLEKQGSGHVLNTVGPLSATLNFPVIFLAKFPRYLFHGLFLDGILGGNLTISDSLQHPRVSGESHLIGGRLADGSSLAFGLTFRGQAATVDFIRLAQRGIDRFAHGEIEFTDLTGIAAKILPNESILETTPLAAGDCVSGIELSAATVTQAQKLPIDEIDFRGSLFDRAWTISLSGKIPDDPYQTLRTPVARTFPFCRENESSGKPLTLGLAPVAFP